MRLHRLDLTAFGPFPGRESIDFDALSGAGLFLLRGETGSGKTSLLDAVCFGLYGRLPGVRAGSEKRIRSDYAQPEVAPEVEVEFSVRGRRLRVTRSPEWERPKKRGTGSTRAMAKALVAEWDGQAWNALSSRLDEVGQLVGAVLGMDVHQFTRVAMLPQGEFAAFLRSTDADREKLLKRLFDTALFDTTVEQAQARKKELAEQVGARGQARQAMVAQLAGNVAAHFGEHILEVGREPLREQAGAQSEPTQREVPAAPGDSAGSVDAADAAERPGDPDWFERLGRHAQHGVDQAEALLRERRELSTTARVASDEGAQRVSDAAQLAQWLRRHEALEAGRTAADADEARLSLHQRGVAVRSELDAAASGKKTLERAVDGGHERLASLRAVPLNTLTAEGISAEDWNAYLDQSAEEAAERDAPRVGATLEWIATAEAAAESAAQALKAEHLAASARKHAQQRAAAADKARIAAQAARDAVAKAEQGLATAVDAAAKAPAPLQAPESWDAEHERAVALHGAAERAQKAQHAVGKAEEAAAGAAAALGEAERELDRVREARSGALVAVLAAELVDAQPCPVCGSPDHPEPATTQESLPVQLAEQTLKAAEVALAGAREQREARLTAVSAAQAAHAEASAAAQGFTPETAQAQSQAVAARRAESAAQQQAHRAATLHAEEAQKLHAAATAAAQAKDEALLGLEAELEQAQAAVSEAEQLAQEAAAGHQDLPSRRAAIGTWLTALGAAREAWSLVASARVQAATAAQRAQEALERAGMSAEAAAQAVLPQQQADVVAARVRAVAGERAKLQELEATEPLKRARLADQGGVVVPHDEALADLAAAAVQAAKASDEAATALGLVRAVHQDIERQAQQVARLDLEVGPLLRKSQTAAAIADVLAGNGENQLNMSLPTYVLAARLESVAEAATHRLDAMSDGRYRLVHVDAKSGNRKSGLGLAVEDSWTGVQRAPQTLSGGESFMASLALALGLADVVQEESGGVDVETLFVDEGFGTLDPETLELVLDGLDQLRRGGRLVGVVSHVAELGSRIPAQVRVSKTRQGSTAQVVGVGESD
ncbi:AAA family ATPase [Galactobacter caseinivorans]|uniref:Nuclease SbcCD subunit C n=1 Tax=Galactobacter caseinivorans TaxID=2676123 RepID=A0A496PMX1_9MICC|nr:SMC family ATPase [Galactobacter caseinivorans]RKW71890.1 SMC family ATPase [Galactobacter caseinivorans]